MPAGPVPTGTRVLTSVSVGWNAVVVGGAPVTGYTVRRYDSITGVEGEVGGTCAGVVAATSCTDTSATLGSWEYTVTPLHGSWTGTESARSAPVVL